MPDVNFSNQYPYTDFHELNLDWVIKEVKYWSTKVGKTIQSITLTGTVGLVDTYTINYSDGSTSTFDVTNGNGITSVAKTGTAGLVDTYTITFQDGSTSTFNVTNGTANVVQTTGTSTTSVMSQDAVTKRLFIYKSSITNQNILTDVFDVGLYTIAPVALSNITGYPLDYDVDDYSLLFVYYSNIRILRANASNKAWIRTTSAIPQWYRINPDVDLFNFVLNSFNAGMGIDGNDLTGTTYSGYLIPSTGANAGKPVSYSDPAFCYESYNVSTHQIYKIRCGAQYSNCFYSILDQNGNVLDFMAHSGSSYDEIETIIKIPEDGYALYLSYKTSGNSPYAKNNIFFLLSDSHQWNGKKWTVLGDSLTEVNIRTSKHYFDYISDKTGISVVNMGLSGSGYAKKADTNQAFYQRAANIPTDSDVVTIFGSGNDLSSGLSLGSPTDSGTTTICGCINNTLDVILNTFMTASKVPYLGVITPTPWVGHDPGDNTDTMTAYCNAIIECCKAKSIPVLDLYRCSNLHPNDATFRSLAYSHDEGNGVHPDETGHKLISGMIENFVKSLILSI